MSTYTPTNSDLARIPDALKARRQWLLWKGADKARTDGSIGLDKIPINPHKPDHEASSTDPMTWSTYEHCLAALPVPLEEWQDSDPAGYRGGGIGFVFTADDPFTGVDLDHSIDTNGVIAPWAQDIITRLDSYTQRSCSGTGLHVIVKSTLPPGRRQDGNLQMWDDKRFFAMTGWHVTGTPEKIEARQGELEALWCEHFAPRPGENVWCYDEHGTIANPDPWTIVSIGHAPNGSPFALFQESTTGWPLVRCQKVPAMHGQAISPAMTDNQVLAHLRTAKNKDKFARLWGGDIDGYASQSEADAALCCMLAFYTQDFEQIRRLFEQSELCREKWLEREDYRYRTIEGALKTCVAYYQPGSSTTNSPLWQEPEDLPAEMPIVPSLPDDMIPAPLRPWLTDIATRMQVPLEFPTVPAIIGLGTVVGRRLAIYPKRHDDWLVVPNIWGAVVGRPGALKTPALQEALRPLDRLVAAAMEQFKYDADDFDTQATVHTARLEALEAAIKKAAKTGNNAEVQRLAGELNALKATAPTPVIERRYKTSDTTVEKLGEILQNNPDGVLLFRDELSGWLYSLDKTGREGDRQFYLESWNGNGSFTWDRIGRGTVHVDALCLSIVGGIQPGKLDAYVRDSLEGGSGDDGLLQRFQLLVWPDISSSWENIDRYPDTTAKNAAFTIYRDLDALRPADFGATLAAPGEIPALRFSLSAQELFDTWRTELEKRLRDGSIDSPAFESHIAKYRSLMPSLALLFHLVDVVAGHQTNAAVVSECAARNAAIWCEFLEAHARRVYAAALHSNVHAAHALAKRIKRGDVKDGDSVRSIYRRQWTQLRTPEAVGDALAILETHHWLRVEEQITGGRPAEIIRLNPEFYQNA
jgi:putative DNA primase/helicase